MGPPKIVIIGAGPAGLTLARLLRHHQIACTVYEGEPDRHSRNQGGTLDLHQDSGQLALAEAGLIAEFQKIARPEAECLKLINPSGDVLWDENVMGNWRPAEASNRPEVDRTALRNMLLDSLEPGVVQWGRRISRVEVDPVSNAKHAIVFEDGHQETGIDLLVGADGAWSKVRPLVTDVDPHYSGITGIEIEKRDVDEENPWLSNHIGKGSCFMAGESRALLCQRLGNNSIRTYACLRVPLNWLKDCGIDWSDAATARKTIAESYFDHCGDDIKRTIIESDSHIIPRHLYMLPVGLTWESRPGITLLGDAAHLMTPFGGVGVNAAMADALDLGRALIARRDSFLAKMYSDQRNITIAIEEYEKLMFARAEKYTKKTWTNLLERFSEGSMERWAARMKGHYENLKQEGKAPA